MKKNIIIFLLITLLLTFGCSRPMSGGLTASNFQSFPAAISAKTPGLAYDDSYTSWEGTGYNGNETQVSAYRDMSNLYGRIRQETEEELNPTDSISVDLSNVERKLVKNASVRIRVENLEAADASVNELMRKYDAYASSTNIQETHYYYTLRVPSPVYDFFLADMNGMGRLLDRLESTEDVTIRYYDLEGRLETKRQLLRTFQLYLGRANNIQEILAVEARIAELQYDIEGTGMQLRSLANRVDYATINLTLLGPVAAIQNRGETFGEQIKQLFGNFGGFLSTVAVVITGIVIYGIPVLLLLIFFFWLLFGRIGLMKKLWQIVKGKK